MARTHKAFGPLLYGTLVVAAVLVPVGVVFQIWAWSDWRAQATVESPDVSVEALIPVATTGASEPRAAAIRSLGEALHRYGPSDDLKGAHGRGFTALRGALKDNDESVRAAAAEALGGLNKSAHSASGDLMAALNDADLKVRIAAARALIGMGEEFNAPALRILAELAGFPAPVPDRRAIVDVMMTAGEPGAEAAVKALVRLLSNEDEGLRSDAVSCVSSLGPRVSRILPALQPLLKSENPGVRYTAALAAMQAMDAEQKPDPLVIATLERAVIDTSLSYSMRESAIGSLYAGTAGGPSAPPAMGAGGMAGGPIPTGMVPGSSMAGPLRRCGRELARQLDHKDADVRLAAAMLLHLIDAETLAGKNEPEEGP